MDILKNEWDNSYSRHENFIFCPKEEVVKFLNRFVCKRSGIDEYKDVMDLSANRRILDLGCGIGRQTLLMKEFGLDAYGVDISSKAIATARALAASSGFSGMQDRFLEINGTDLPFESGFFNVTVCEAVLDSMSFDVARRLMQEIARVTRSLVFVSLIAGHGHKNGDSFDGEEIVSTVHERGTIQSYFSVSKIARLTDGLGLSQRWGELIVSRSLDTGRQHGRYYLVFGKKS